MYLGLGSKWFSLCSAVIEDDAEVGCHVNLERCTCYLSFLVEAVFILQLLLFKMTNFFSWGGVILCRSFIMFLFKVTLFRSLHFELLQVSHEFIRTASVIVVFIVLVHNIVYLMQSNLG